MEHNSSRFSLTNLMSNGIPDSTSNESVILILLLSLFLLILFTYKVSTWPSSPVFTVFSSSSSISEIFSSVESV
jgi:hypothetical protein